MKICALSLWEQYNFSFLMNIFKPLNQERQKLASIATQADSSPIMSETPKQVFL